MVYELTIEHLVSLALRKTDVDAKRAVRNLLRAMADPVLGASGVITQSPESTVLADDEDVEGWLATSKATPLCLLAILERCGTASGPATQTPPPDGWRHIVSKDFDTIEELIESTDEEGLTTSKRRRPTTKTGSRKRLGRLRRLQERVGQHIDELEDQDAHRFRTPSR